MLIFGYLGKLQSGSLHFQEGWSGRSGSGGQLTYSPVSCKQPKQACESAGLKEKEKAAG